MSMARTKAPNVIVIMGVASAGKTRLGKKLAKDTGWTFYDADDYHSDANKEKMRQGIGLNDRDRKPWLASLRHLLAGVIKRREHAVLACSALKQSYRTALTPPNVRAGAVRFVYLSVPRSVLEKRLEKRVEKHKNTFAGPSLLDSQLATLEKPLDALWLDGTRHRSTLVDTIRDAFDLS
jgi:carbohydrate kinase (thermoresistant glucokinase family)